MKSELRGKFLSSIAVFRFFPKRRSNDFPGDQDIRQAQQGDLSNRADALSAKNLAPLQTIIQQIHETQKQHQTAERNVWGAQLRTARRLNWITAIGAALSLIGLFFIGYNLVLTRRAADDAHIAATAATDQAKAAVEANKINREVYVADQRPWVDATIPANGTIEVTINNGMILSAMTTDLLNTGKSPAIRATTFSRIARNDNADLAIQFSYSCRMADEAAENGSAVYTIFPNGVRPATVSASRDLIEAGAGVLPRAFFLVGCVSYAPSQEIVRHHTKYCFDWDEGGITRGKSGVFRVEICSAYQDAD
jgi:hypothetical protein